MDRSRTLSALVLDLVRPSPSVSALVPPRPRLTPPRGCDGPRAGEARAELVPRRRPSALRSHTAKSARRRRTRRPWRGLQAPRVGAGVSKRALVSLGGNRRSAQAEDPNSRALAFEPASPRTAACRDVGLASSVCSRCCDAFVPNRLDRRVPSRHYSTADSDAEYFSLSGLGVHIAAELTGSCERAAAAELAGPTVAIRRNSARAARRRGPALRLARRHGRARPRDSGLRLGRRRRRGERRALRARPSRSSGSPRRCPTATSLSTRACARPRAPRPERSTTASRPSRW